MVYHCWHPASSRISTVWTPWDREELYHIRSRGYISPEIQLYWLSFLYIRLVNWDWKFTLYHLHLGCTSFVLSFFKYLKNIILITLNYSIDDSFLQRAVSVMPKQAILLIEDIDCAFPSREELDSDSKSRSGFELSPMDDSFEMDTDISGMVVGGKRAPAKSRSRVTLSGLLNVLDGVGSEEGKIFFATVCILPFQVVLFSSCPC